LGVYAIEVPHRQGKIRIGRFYEQMIVVDHLYPRMDDHPILFNQFPQQPNMSSPIFLIFKYVLTLVPAGSDVVKSIGILDSQRSYHAPNISRIIYIASSYFCHIFRRLYSRPDPVFTS
jgi:hypothetical protein